jgi:hypothetical protein
VFHSKYFPESEKNVSILTCKWCFIHITFMRGEEG